MRYYKKSQISFEYMVVIAFVTFIIASTLSIAMIYGSSIQDQLKMIELTNFINKVTSSAESIYYEGDPAKSTITVYMPSGVHNITLDNLDIVITLQTSTGVNTLSYRSKVPLTGTIPITEGTKKLTLMALNNSTYIS